MIFNNEADFEAALIELLQKKGWEEEILKYPSEEDLIDNWAKILFENNRGIDRLNDYPLTDGEMMQIMEQINSLRTPLKLNAFINGKTISIIRDHPDDLVHYGKEISLKIYDRSEIAAGQSRYQIAQQPRFNTRSEIVGKRRGDLLLLINGMPVIHLELKKSGVSVSQAYYQIEKYANEGVFNGIFSLIQIFVAMEPNDTVYFANPGPDGKFNKDFYFRWADFNNEPKNDWISVTTSLLSIPMAHQLIGFYTVADSSDGVLKVMRSYQYYAANRISDKVSTTDWESNHSLGGYIWHTTGSGKTMTSFKSAQLIANSKDADKVIFLMDRIELGTQSLKEYRSFADDSEDVQATENTDVLISKLKSDNPADTLIVTSIQKMKNVKAGDDGLNRTEIDRINSKRVVFIVDEAHRSTFGDMLITIKNTFPSAMFFGFTGTPIHEENQKKLNTTSTVFGDELHRYSIADGIRDKNVLGFDTIMKSTYRDIDLRTKVALMKSGATSEEQAINDPDRNEIYYHYMDNSKIRMAGYIDNCGKYKKGIEDYFQSPFYNCEQHRDEVVNDIINNWNRLSHGGKFHSIFATNSIPEAIEYYRLFRSKCTNLKVTALFDPNIINDERASYKEDGLEDVILGYNEDFNQTFSFATHDSFKKDVAARLAHKQPYINIHNNRDEQLDILIVVDQMLTGFDSKWINTLYLDKIMKYENIIQAFSRTNRLFGNDKPFGTICYYRKPHTMNENIKKAVKLYSGDKPLGLFVQKLDENILRMNEIYLDIVNLFTKANIPDFEKLPSDNSEKGKFASLFKEFNQFLDAAKIQGFSWNKLNYEFEDNGDDIIIEVPYDEDNYLVLALRYKELFEESSNNSDVREIPFEVDTHLTEIDTGRIDVEYMNSRFEKYLKAIENGSINNIEAQEMLNDLHRSFATLTQDEQKYAGIFLHDIESGNVNLEDGKSFRDYIVDYQTKAQKDEIAKLSSTLGLDVTKLRKIMSSRVTDANINEYGRFDELKDSVDIEKAKKYFEKKENHCIPAFKVRMKVHKLLKEFVMNGGFKEEGN